MALTRRTKDIMIVALADKKAGEELATEVDSLHAVTAAAVVADIGATSNLSALVPTASAITASAGVFAIPAEPTGAEVDTAIDALKGKVDTALDLKADNADVETLRTQVEARLDVIEAKIDELIAALQAASLMDV